MYVDYKALYNKKEVTRQNVSLSSAFGSLFVEHRFLLHNFLIFYKK